MQTWFVRVMASFVVAIFGLTTVASPARAGNEVVRENYAFEDIGVNVCGLIVNVSVEGTFRGTIKEWIIESSGPGSDDFWIGVFNDHGSAVHTNPLNGKTVVERWRANVNEHSMVDLGGGNWEYTRAINGQPVRLGNKLIKDRGTIVLATILYLGDLSTVDDNEFVSEVALKISGPHPAYASDAFCNAYVAALS